MAQPLCTVDLQIHSRRTAQDHHRQDWQTRDQHYQESSEEGADDICDLDDTAGATDRAAVSEDGQEAGYDRDSVCLYLRPPCAIRRYLLTSSQVGNKVLINVI